MKNAAIAVGVLLLLVVIWVFLSKPPSLEDALKSLPAEEGAALDAIAAEGGFSKTDFKSVGIGLLANCPRAVAIEGGHVVELRVADAPIKSFAPFAKFKGLKALWLDGTTLESLDGVTQLSTLFVLNVSRTKVGSFAGLAGHPALGLLTIEHCGLESVEELRDLPQLRELSLKGNPVRDLAALTKLPSLRDLDLTGTEVSALPEPKPETWQIRKDAPPPAPAKPPENWLDDEPKPDGEIKGLAHKGVLQDGDSWLVEGSVESLRGAGRVFGIPTTGFFRGSNVELELETDKGKVRGYLKSSLPDPSRFLGRRLGFVYAEATAGKPGKAVGDIRQLTGSKYGKYRPVEFVVESLDGEANGIRFKLHRHKPQ